MKKNNKENSEIKDSPLFTGSWQDYYFHDCDAVAFYNDKDTIILKAQYVVDNNEDLINGTLTFK